MMWTTERAMVDPRWRLLIAVGFCGGYTTFSSYAYETVAFFEQGQWTLLAANFLANNLLACLAVMAGMALARVL
jgi:CrcB protein